jgi:hypothetical protein
MMKKTLLLSITFFLSALQINAQLISIDLTKPTDTLFFKMNLSTEEVSNGINFKLANVNRFNFGQITMKAHGINPFNLPKIYMNKKIMNEGIYFPKLNQDAIFTFLNPTDTGKIKTKGPIGENAAEISFMFSKKDLLDGVNELEIVINDKDNQDDLTITDLKLNLRAPLNTDNIIVQIPSEFPGGQYGWVRYLERNLDRDLLMRKGAPSGKYAVILSFIIDKEGNVSEVIAETDPGFGAAEEAVRVIKSGPKWIPAKENGINIKNRHRQAIVFVVSNN